MGVSRVVNIGSPYNGEELSEVDFEQTADTMYLAHIDHPVQKLVRAAHDDWTFSDLTFGPPISAPTSCSAVASVPNTDSDNGGNAYFPINQTYCVTALDDDGKESRASNTDSVVNDLTLKRNYNTITWTGSAGAVRYNIYKAEESQFFGYIGTTDQTTFTDNNIGPALDKAPPEAFDPFGSAGNYPSTVTFFEQRMILGRTNNSPNAVWGSRSSDFENFDRSQPLRDDDSLSFAVVAGRVNAVNQLVSTTSLLALTSDSIFRVDGDPNGGYLTATQIAVRRQIGRGCSRLSPLVVDNVVFYAPSVGSSVRTINYSFEIDGLKSDDVSIFSPHFLAGFNIVSWCYAQEPRSVIWAVRSDGKLLCFTWEQAQQVWGWTLCETDGEYLSCCAISEGGEDRVYFIVRRTINGVTKTFIERMASATWDSVADSCYLDCAISFSYETPQTVFRNLWHLEGATVWGLIDGQVIKDLAVSGGVITLPSTVAPASKATFGIPYDVDIQTNPVVFQSQGVGSNVGRKQQVGEIVLHLHESRGVQVGSGKADSSEPLTYEIKPRGMEAWGDPDELLTGKYLADSTNVVAGEASVYVKQTDPLPLTLLGVYLDPIVSS
jgi:hypothetical protein